METREELPPIYNEFKTIYKQEFGIDLTSEEAYEIGSRLLTLAKTIITKREQEKVIEYKQLTNVKSKKELEYLCSELANRFGKYPSEVENLLKIVELRISTSETGLEAKEQLDLICQLL